LAVIKEKGAKTQSVLKRILKKICPKISEKLNHKKQTTKNKKYFAESKKKKGANRLQRLKKTNS